MYVLPIWNTANVTVDTTADMTASISYSRILMIICFLENVLGFSYQKHFNFDTFKKVLYENDVERMLQSIKYLIFNSFWHSKFR